MPIDLNTIIQPLIATLWYLVPLSFLIGFLKSSWFKGKVGEWLINTASRFCLGQDEYHLIKDVTLPTDDGTTQIDHIIVSRFGVFVIETKNMKGWIFGSGKQRMWTQQIYRTRHRFMNPLHQNYKHVKTLEALADIPAAAIHSLVVFVGSAEFKTEMPANVTTVRGYLSNIKSKRDVVLNPMDVEAVIAKIEQLRLTRGLKTDRQHVRHLREKQAATQLPHVQSPSENTTATDTTTDLVRASLATPLATPLAGSMAGSMATPQCPKCGHSMVSRHSKKGKHAGSTFWGCSTYPACRATINASLPLDSRGGLTGNIVGHT